MLFADKLGELGDVNMATLLIIVIFFDFIGLGVPDSLFGTAWPAINAEFGLPTASANIVFLTVTGCTVVSSLFSARVIRRFGTPLVTVVSTAMTAVAILGFSVSGNIWIMALLSIPLGLGAGAIDSGLNNYVSLHYSAMHMNMLHCFYGIGVSITPYILGSVMNGGGGWRGGYRSVFVLQLFLTVLAFASLPLWKRNGAEAVEEESTAALSVRQTASIKGVKTAALLLMADCAVESACNSWCSTYLVSARGLSAADAATAAICYYAGLAVGRLVSGIISVRLSGIRIISLATALLTVAIILLALPLNTVAALILLFLMGFAIGPVFPNVIRIVPHCFGREASQSVIGLIMAASYVSMALSPLIFGFVSQELTPALLPYYLLIMTALLVTALALLKRALRAQGKTLDA